MAGSVRQRLSDSLSAATKAEKAIAAFMLSNLNNLPFETSASLAHKVGVSEPMIGRFCRSLGYAHFKELKADLRDNIGDRPWLVGDRLREFRERSLIGDSQMARSLDLQISALVRIYEMAQTKEWSRAVRRLAKAGRIFVVGFQTERGLAQYFANQMQYLRKNVHLVDLAGGNFSELLLGEPKSTCLVMFEARRYSKLAFLLAAEAQKAKIPVTLITDGYCNWGHQLVSELFVVPTDFNMFWDSTAHMASLGNLLLNALFNELDASVETRMNKVSELHGKFIGHVGE